MNPLAALQELENAVAQLSAPRDIHVKWMECAKVIGLALVERESLKMIVDKDATKQDQG